MKNLFELDEHCIFSTREKSDSHALVAAELADHFLRWNGNQVDARMCKIETENLSLYSLRYGSGVDIFPGTYKDFSLVHFSLKKAIDVTADQQRIRVPTGRALISSPRRNISLSYEDGCEQIIIRVPHALTSRMARKMGQLPLQHKFEQSSGLLLSEASSAFWQAQLEGFLALDFNYRKHDGLSAWRTHFEENFALFLLTQFGPLQVADEPIRSSSDALSARRLERLVAYVHAHLQEPMTLLDMAQATALSERQLNVLCHEAFGESPVQWLRGLRLDAIRKSLLADPSQNLSALAMQFGFFHLGRFPAYYKQRFGELPSQTLRTTKNG